ncbi:MAG: DUF3291 domain-containing protein [Anaerolineaceae bacterium]
MTGFHLAQYNIAWLLAPLDDPRLADFTANLDRVNKLADDAPGFVWRHQEADGNSTSIRIRDDDRLIINFSVWESAEALFEYAFHSDHVAMFRRRTEWFTHEEQPYAVLWWVAKGHVPTVEEAEARLAQLGAEGPTAAAFTFKTRFRAPGA